MLLYSSRAIEPKGGDASPK